MKLSYLLEALASGELSNLNLAEDNINIKPEKKVIVLRAINRGLADLHSRFTLRKAYTSIDVVLDKDGYMVSAPDFIEISDIYLNDKRLIEGADYRLLGTQQFEVKHKLGLLDDLRVEYKAGHQVLTELDLDFDSEVNLPSPYLNALLYFVANCLISPRQNQLDGDMNEGNIYARKYQDEIVMLTHQGIDVDTLTEHSMFSRKGFL